MINTIIVDDEPRGISTLNKLLQEYCPEVKVIAECADADSAKEKIELLQPQLVFLDISLPGKNSFDMLAELKTIAFEIIFVTAHNQYTLQAFKYSAVDYLMKPIDEDLLVNAVKRAVKRISSNSDTNHISALLHNLQKNQSHKDLKLCIPSVKGFQVVELKHILYCESTGSYTNFHFEDGRHMVSAKPIFEYEELLGEAGFIRIHKSFLINLYHLKEYLRGEGGSVILSNNKEIEVSRRRKDILLEKIKVFYKL